jgi:hypothetical protein
MNGDTRIVVLAMALLVMAVAVLLTAPMASAS